MPRRWICCASLRQTERRENLDTDLIERAKVTVDDKMVPKRRGCSVTQRLKRGRD
jgi:hypothetical protein